jgi:peptidoglycan/xylan/chitin deacetylase (PgdA/CDA1 family)
VCTNARNGAIICLHDGRGMAAVPDISGTLAAVNVIIPKLGDRGFEFTTVSDLLCLS